MSVTILSLPTHDQVVAEKHAMTECRRQEIFSIRSMLNAVTDHVELLSLQDQIDWRTIGLLRYSRLQLDSIMDYFEIKI